MFGFAINKKAWHTRNLLVVTFSFKAHAQSEMGAENWLIMFGERFRD